MSKGKDLKLKHKGKIHTYMRIKKGKDGSVYLILDPSNNPDGEHLSYHTSGILNLRSKSKDRYDLIPTIFNEMIIPIIDKAIVPIKDVKQVLLITKGLSNRYVKDDVIDADKFEKDVYTDLHPVYEIDNDSELEDFPKYASANQEVLYITKKGHMLMPIKELPGKALDVEIMEKLIEKIEL